MVDPGYRRFWLEDDTGERVGLNGEHDIVLLNPTGLGYTSNVQYSSLKTGFFTTTVDDDPQQISIVGDLYFHGDEPYLQYRFFTDWILKAKTLYLLYEPRVTTYRCRVKLDYLTKTEKDKTGALKVPVSFKGLTPWYLPESSDGITEFMTVRAEDRFIFDESLLDGGKVFEASEPNDRKMIVRYRGQTPGSFSVTANGPIVNPVITLYDYETMNAIGKCELSTTIDAASVLEYNSEPGNSYVRCKKSGKSYDLINSIVDFTSDIYPRIPIDTTVMIEVSGRDELYSEINITTSEYKRGV